MTVELTYYVPIFPVDNAVMELVSRNGRALLKLTGEVCWHPVMEAKKNQYGGFGPSGSQGAGNRRQRLRLAAG